MKGSAHIIGGGIGGLAAGRALIAGGWDVTIHERQDDLPKAGTALAMWPHALKALAALGLEERIHEQSVRPREGFILHPDGRRIARIAPPTGARAIPRHVLLGTLYDGLPSGVVHWHSPVNDNTTLSDADVIVGADGTNSKVRAGMFGPGADPRPLGTVAYRGVVPGSQPRYSETWGPGQLFGITPYAEESTNWFACIRESRAHRPDHGTSDLDLLKWLYRGWHPDVGAVLDRVEPATIDRRPLTDMAPLRSFVSGQRVLVGDAAHTMAPNLGRGACEALVDGVTLATSLNEAPSVAEGLRRYDRARRRRTQRVVTMSRIMNRATIAERFTTPRNGVISAFARLI